MRLDRICPSYHKAVPITQDVAARPEKMQRGGTSGGGLCTAVHNAAASRFR